MKRKEMKLAALVLAGLVAVSDSGFSAHAARLMTVLPVAGVGLKLEEGTSVEELERLVLGEQGDHRAVSGDTAENVGGVVAAPVLENSNVIVANAQDSDDDLVTVNGMDEATGHTGEDAESVAKADDEAFSDEGETSESDSEAENEAEVDSEEEMEEEYGNLVIAQVRDWVNVRSGPSTNSEILGKLYNNSVGEMIRTEGDWYYIASGTVTGYVKAEYCVTGAEAEAMVDEVSVKVARVNAETLNLRKKPSTNSSVLKQLPFGDELEVISTEHDGWVEVNVNGTVGYVSAEYVTVSLSFVSAESIEEEAQRLEEERAEREEAQRREAEEAAAQEAARQEAEQAAQTQEQPAEQPPQDAAVQETPAEETATVTTTGSELGVEVANFALQYVGNPYVYGGTSLTNGADCSGFVLAVYANFGVSLPHSATADRKMGTAVNSLAEARPGDLVCYSGHVGIYIGNGQIVHASTPRSGIKISDANYKPIACIRRIFN